MKIKFILFFLFTFISTTFAIEDKLTITDKEILEKLIRLEEGQKRLEVELKATNRRIDDTNKRIDDLQSIMLTGFGILFAGMFTLIVFIIWDRRTALVPVLRKTKEIEERQEKLVDALKSLAKDDERIREILKQYGFL